MACFKDDEFRWERVDVSSLIDGRGIGTIDPERRPACLAWLKRQGYQIVTVDGSEGVEKTVKQLDQVFRWQDQFGYSLFDSYLEGKRLNLNALQDGFHFDIPEGGFVLEIYRPDLSWQKPFDEFLALMAIAARYSCWQLALGNRFFVLLTLPGDSPLIDREFDRLKIPLPFWSPARVFHLFQDE